MTIYLDHSATTPLREEVLEAMLPFLREHHGNPNSLHAPGRRARHAVEDARAQVAALLGAEPRDLVFTSGATEANALALWGATEGADAQHLAVSAVEHSSVLKTAQDFARRRGLRLDVIPVDGEGLVPLEQLDSVLSAGAQLVSVMLGNNETGVLQPVEQIGVQCRLRKAILHCDAAQAAGKLPLPHLVEHCDLVTVSAHKFGGPKGIGTLYVKRGTRLTPQLVGIQERGRRGGTENVAGIVGFGKACELARRDLLAAPLRMRELRDRLSAGILSTVPSATLNSAKAERLPHIANIAFEGLDGEALVLALDAGGVAVSSGAACSSGSAQASHVLLAMGQSHVTAQSAVRFSVGYSTTEADIDAAVGVIAATAQQLLGRGSSVTSRKAGQGSSH